MKRKTIGEHEAEDALRIAGWAISGKKWMAMSSTGGTSPDVVQQAMLRILKYPHDADAALSTIVVQNIKWAMSELYRDREKNPICRAESLELDAPIPERPDRDAAVDEDRILLIKRWLRGLTYREREIIRLRYGLVDGNRYTLTDCGRIFRVTRERIRQMESKALKKLQRRAAEELRRALRYSVYECRVCGERQIGNGWCCGEWPTAIGEIDRNEAIEEFGSEVEFCYTRVDL